MVNKYEKEFLDLGKDFRRHPHDDLPKVGKSLYRNSTTLRQKRRVHIRARSSTRSRRRCRLIGGSGDLTPSNNTYIKSSEIFKPDNTKPQHSFRRPRTRDGFDDERYGSIRKHNTVRGNFPDIFRLYAAVDSSRRAVPYSGGICVHARFDRAGRGRSDASIGRTSRRLTRNSELGSHSPVRRARNPRSMASRA